MPFERPSLPTLIARTAADLSGRLADGQPLLPVSNLAVLGRVNAGAVHGLYGYLDWIARQILPDTADAEVLERHAGIWGLSRVAASYAAGAVTLTGTAGSVVPAGTGLRRQDGVSYLSTVDVTLAGSTADVPVQAVAAGASPNAAAGVSIALVSALSGVNAAGVVAGAGLTGGAEQESDTALRARLLARIQMPPQGGSATDYVAWALAAHPAVTRAWCYPEELGPGAVTVRVMTDGATPDGIPDAPVIAAVQAALDLARPVTAAVVAVAPVAAPLALTITAAPGTSQVRAAISGALADLILAEAVPGGTLLLSHLREAISGAAGETDHTLTSPSANVTAAAGAITTLGTITWI